MPPDRQNLARVDGTYTSIVRRGLALKIAWAALGMFAVPLLMALFSPYPLPDVIRVALGYGLLASPAVALLALTMRLFGWSRLGSVSVVEGGLSVERGGRTRIIPLASIAEGFVNPLRREVEIRTRNGNLVQATVPDLEAGRRLLEAIGLDASRRTMRARLGETVFLDILSLLFGFGLAGVVGRLAGALTPWPGPVALIAGLAVIFGVFRAAREVFGPAELVVGADGVMVRQSFRSRFYAYERLAGIDFDANRVTLRLHDGTCVAVRARHLNEEQGRLLCARLDEARAAFRAGAADPTAVARLDRNGRSLAAWREALRGVLSRADGYREPTVTPEQLARCVESAATPVERRVAAAVALSAAGDPEAVARVRVAAEASASPRIRVALAGAASGEIEEEALEEALAEERATTRPAPGKRAT